jgi:hypothetical protein
MPKILVISSVLAEGENVNESLKRTANTKNTKTPSERKFFYRY